MKTTTGIQERYDQKAIKPPNKQVHGQKIANVLELYLMFISYCEGVFVLYCVNRF